MKSHECHIVRSKDQIDVKHLMAIRRSYPAEDSDWTAIEHSYNQELHEKDNRLFFTAYAEDELPVAYVQLILRNADNDPELANGHEIAHIHDLRVAQNLQGKGHGRNLMRHIENEARFLGKSILTLGVDNWNHRAINFYPKLGYIKFKEASGRTDEEICFLMKKDIKEIVLIGDANVKNIPVQECGEPMVDLRTEFPALTFDLERIHVQKEAESISYARRTIGKKLKVAQSKLPSGLKLIIKECYRPTSVQKGFWDSYTAFLKKKFPDWSDEEIYAECSKLNAPLEVAPHTTGGAVDLTLASDDGTWLDMGTEFNASPLQTMNATYTNAKNISDVARSNRKILIDVMSAVGFANYPTEWWHWSYGDKYWALLTNQPAAIYGSKEISFCLTS